MPRGWASAWFANHQGSQSGLVGRRFNAAPTSPQLVCLFGWLLPDVAVAVQECCHRVTVRSVQWTIRPINPTRGHTSRLHPLDLLIEHVPRTHISERRNTRSHESRRPGTPIQESSHRITRHRSRRTERAIRPTSGDTGARGPLDLLVELIRRGHIRERLTRRRKRRRTSQTIDIGNQRITIDRRHRTIRTIRPTRGDPLGLRPANIIRELITGSSQSGV